MSDKEIFELIAFSGKVLTSGDEYPKEGFSLEQENQWKYIFLTDTFQFRMGWVEFTFKRDIKLEDNREIWGANPSIACNDREV